jgi:hypothetical protein
MQRWVVAVQAFRRESNGIRFLHRLVDELNKLGRNASLAFIKEDTVWSQEMIVGSRDLTNREWNTPVLERLEDARDAIVFYPEVVYGNPLGSDRVVRYFGNRNGVLTGQKVEVPPGDYVVAHSRVLYPEAQSTLFYSEISPCFHAERTRRLRDRVRDMTYDGKGALYGPTPVIPNTRSITRHWPHSQERLAEMMRETRIFHTWDAWTSTNVEAVLCGAILMVRRYDPWTPADLDGCEIGPLPRVEVGADLPSNEAYEEARQQMVEKLAGLQRSWGDRLEAFVESAEAFF